MYPVPFSETIHTPTPTGPTIERSALTDGCILYTFSPSRLGRVTVSESQKVRPVLSFFKAFCKLCILAQYSRLISVFSGIAAAAAHTFF